MNVRGRKNNKNNKFAFGTGVNLEISLIDEVGARKPDPMALEVCRAALRHPAAINLNINYLIWASHWAFKFELT